MSMFMSKIPISYNIRSVRARFTSTLVAIAGIAGVVMVFLGMLALAHGFRQTMVSSGSPDNVLIRRSGSSSEMDSAVGLGDFRILRDLPEVAQDIKGAPAAVAEVVLIIPLKQKATGTEANVQVRGFSGNPLAVRPAVKLLQGRLPEPGKPELAVGSGAAKLYQDTEVGAIIPMGGRNWEVVGVFDAGGSAFDSEVWTDAILIRDTFNRSSEVFSSVTLKLAQGVDVRSFRERVDGDPRLNLSIQPEQQYYSEKSQLMANLITTLGYLIVSVMGVGAVFAALNTMSSTISARSREVATLRSLGFSGGSIVFSFILESIMIALLGGVLGCLLVLPIHGYQASTMNWDTFSHLGFAIQLSPAMMGMGLTFAMIMGIIGGWIPAAHAARRPIVDALREL
jgi:putative ABC transport system permease protein